LNRRNWLRIGGHILGICREGRWGGLIGKFITQRHGGTKGDG
jgi:hypothetical protein